MIRTSTRSSLLLLGIGVASFSQAYQVQTASTDHRIAAPLQTDFSPKGQLQYAVDKMHYNSLRLGGAYISAGMVMRQEFGVEVAELVKLMPQAEELDMMRMCYRLSLKEPKEKRSQNFIRSVDAIDSIEKEMRGNLADCQYYARKTLDQDMLMAIPKLLQALNDCAECVFYIQCRDWPAESFMTVRPEPMPYAWVCARQNQRG